MSKDKHTPGPWRIDPFDGKILGPTIGASSPIVAQLPVWWPNKLPGEHVSQELQASNARLISAAPELLAACEMLRKRLINWTEIQESCDIREDDENAINAGQQAIAKALGEI